LPESSVVFGIAQMYINRKVYLCNAILVTKIFRYRYSTINNSAKNNIFFTKFGVCFRRALRVWNYGTFVLTYFHFRERKFYRWYFRSLEFSFTQLK